MLMSFDSCLSEFNLSACFFDVVLIKSVPSRKSLTDLGFPSHISIDFITRNGETFFKVRSVFCSFLLITMYFGPSVRSDNFWFFEKKLVDANVATSGRLRLIFCSELLSEMCGKLSQYSLKMSKRDPEEVFFVGLLSLLPPLEDAIAP